MCNCDPRCDLLQRQRPPQKATNECCKSQSPVLSCCRARKPLRLCEHSSVLLWGIIRMSSCILLAVIISATWISITILRTRREIAELKGDVNKLRQALDRIINEKAPRPFPRFKIVTMPYHNNVPGTREH
jgi:hypothetical protein